MNKNYKKLILIIALISVFIFSGNSILAQHSGGSGVAEDNLTHLDNPLGLNNADPRVLIGLVIKAILGLVGSLALVIFIYGGFVWMTASGNVESVTKGKNILIWATIGLVIIFTSYTLVYFILKTLVSR